MVGIVVRDEQGLAEDRLAGPVRDAGRKVRRGIFYQPFHGAEVGLKRLNASVPGGRVGRRVGFRPVAFGKLRRDVLSVAAEFEDVPLRNAHVLEQPPCRKRKSGGADATQLRREVREDLFKGNVRAATVQQIQQMLTQGPVQVSGRRSASWLFFRNLASASASRFGNSPGTRILQRCRAIWFAR